MKKALFLVLLTSALLLSSCRPPEGYIDNSRPASESQDKEGNAPALEISMDDWTYMPITMTNERAQYSGEHLYFEGDTQSIYKYSLADGTISSPCTDPLCSHSGMGASCRMGRHVSGCFYKVRGEHILYDVFGFDIYSYNTSTMENLLLDDSREGIASGNMTVSDDYLYFMAYVVDENTGEMSSAYRRVNLSNGESEMFLESEQSRNPYELLGAANGKIYWTDRAYTTTYISDESDPENLKIFWNATMSYIWIGEKDMCFRAKDPDSGEYCFYRTDLDGNVISKVKIEGNMKWGSLCDGKHLYYISAEDTPLYLEDGAAVIDQKGYAMTGNNRTVYCLDIDTGERSVAFTFDGDYSALYLRFSMGHVFYVVDGKIITSYIGGYWLRENEEGELVSEYFDLHDGNNGISIIDMENGDIKYIGPLKDGTIGIEIREMRIGKETE